MKRREKTKKRVWGDWDRKAKINMKRRMEEKRRRDDWDVTAALEAWEVRDAYRNRH